MAALCEFFRIGRIVRPHGVHGAVKLEPLSDSLMRYKGLKEAYLERTDGTRELVAVSDVGVKGDAVYMTISASTSRDDAELLRGAYISVDRAHAMKLPKDVYFVEDLVGMRVYDDKDDQLGIITNVYQTGANDVYHIKGERTLYLPALKKAILLTDIEGRRMVLDSKVLGEVGLFED